MAMAALAVMAASTVISAYGQQQQGKAQQNLANYQADQITQNAGQQKASGQAAALNQDTNTSLTLSRARAVAAASGGSMNDSSIVQIMSNIAAEGGYRSNVARYQGDTQSNAMVNQAAATRMGGSIANQGANIAALSTVMSGAAGSYSMYNKYGFGSAGSANTNASGIN